MISSPIYGDLCRSMNKNMRWTCPKLEGIFQSMASQVNTRDVTGSFLSPKNATCDRKGEDWLTLTVVLAVIISIITIWDTEREHGGCNYPMYFMTSIAIEQMDSALFFWTATKAVLVALMIWDSILGPTRVTQSPLAPAQHTTVINHTRNLPHLYPTIQVSPLHVIFL